jgi:restriction system protein
MGGIWLPRNELITSTSEIVGYKAGLCLNQSEMARFIPESCLSYWNGPSEATLRIRSEEFEDLVQSVLYGVGYTSNPQPDPYGISLIHKYKNDKRKFKILEDVMGLRNEWMGKFLKMTKSKSIDPTSFILEAIKKHGSIGGRIATEIINGIVEYEQGNPWSTFRRVEWIDVAELKDLFTSESLNTFYGSFIDQRYIDYLERNFDDIDGINWRKFEALTCEFFKHEGYYVEIGKGRNDDGIDARIWPSKESVFQPPVILVQCKRCKEKVGKTVVKALWADVEYEKAGSGLVVTTSSIAPGAKKSCNARGYKIDEANRDTLKTWVRKMRTPFTGVFLGD